MAAWACGAGPEVGPSPLVAPPPATTAAPTLGTAHRSGLTTLDVPGVAPELVAALLFGCAPNDNPHALEAWEGGPMRHCVGAGIDPAVVARAAAIVSEATGIPQREDGPCNVAWEVLAPPAFLAPFGAGYAQNAHASGAPSGPIVSTRIVFKEGVHVGPADALHELGHAIGLGHTLDPRGVMYGRGVTATGFTWDERAVIAAVYR